MKAIIYCRKSTDRWDRQQLSVSAQESEARKIAKREWLEIIEVFRETKSAKEPWRPQFNQMMSLFTKKKADCIITWKLNRLARNPVDEWTIKWSIQNGIIKTIYTQSETFKTGDNVLIMWMQFWMSTQYILDLQVDINRWIKRKIEMWWVCQKAPIWYINDTINKSVEVDSKKSQWVKEMFTLRSQNMAFKTISEMLYKKWIKKDNWEAFPVSTIETLLKNKFYIWLVKHNWEYYKWNYKTFISNSLFEKAQYVWQWISYRENTARIYHLKWLLKANNGYLLSWYSKKWHIYYKSTSRDSENVNINQDKIFKYFLEELMHFKIDEDLKVVNKEIILNILEAQKPKDFETIKEIEFKIRKLTTQKDWLLELRLGWEIEKEVFLKKNNSLVLNIQELEAKKKELKGNSIENKLDVMLELIGSLSVSYKLANYELKSVILKNLMLELFIDNKKELSYAENSLLNSLKLLQNTSKNIMEAPDKVVSELYNNINKLDLDDLKWLLEIVKQF